MNLKVYNVKDKLKETINAMAYVQTKDELDKLFASAIAELLNYQMELKKKVE